MLILIEFTQKLTVLDNQSFHLSLLEDEKRVLRIELITEKIWHKKRDTTFLERLHPSVNNLAVPSDSSSKSSGSM